MQSAHPEPGAGTIVEVTQSKEKVFNFVRELLNDVQADFITERRAHPRHSVCMAMEAIPFDVRGQQAGEAFLAVVKDISASGLSFLHHSVILDRYLLVRFPESGRHKSQWIVLEVVRGQQVGPLWEIGGRSVAEPKAD
jgi:hypothetical protein